MRKCIHKNMMVSLLLTIIAFINLMLTPMSVFAEDSDFSTNGEEITENADKVNNVYCQDMANMFKQDTINYINKKSRELDDNTGAQIVVISINSLDGNAIEDTAIDVFRNLGIGDKEKNNGILLLIAKDDREFRIQTGTGIEGCLPDVKCKDILSTLSSRFKANSYDEGVIEAFNTILTIVAKEYDYDAGVQEESLVLGVIILVFGILVIIVIIGIASSDSNSSSGSGGHYYGGYVDIYLEDSSSDFGSSFGGGTSDGGGASEGW